MAGISVEELMQKYKSKLDSNLTNEEQNQKSEYIKSVDYETFKKDNIPKSFSYYEKACNFAKKILPIGVDKKTQEKYEKAIHTAHLNLDSTGIVSLSLLIPFLVLLLIIPIGFLLNDIIFFTFAALLCASVIYFLLNKLIFNLARNWRQEAGNQMVLSVFYMVTYMRQNSNFENALYFAATHIEGPLALDFKKIIWDVQSGKYFTLNQSMDAYLETWRDYNMEFIESVQLIQSSLLETDESRRVLILEKSLSVILEETYEKMLHYAHDLQGPIQILNMLGIVLPIMGLVILPLVVSFFENVQWYYLAFGYNILIPFGVYILGNRLFEKRPVGYGSQDYSKYLDATPDKVSFLKIFKNISLVGICVFVLFSGIIFTLMPQIIHTTTLVGAQDPDTGVEGVTIWRNEFGEVENDDIELYPSNNIKKTGIYLLEYKSSTSTPPKLVGPYGLGASIFSFGLPIGLALAIGIFFYFKTRYVVKIRDNAKVVEKEFSSALFQLGNRLGDGIPLEIAFAKVSNNMRGTISGKLFQTIATNASVRGQDIKTAIFDRKTGAIKEFPSNIIESSLKVLVESVRKGPKIASIAIMNISTYIKEIHKVHERLRDLLTEVISGMKSQTKFLAPVIASIVVGITSMINAIISQLNNSFQEFKGEGTSSFGAAGQGDAISTFIKDGLPTYYFQVIVGIYVVQLIFILSDIISQIEDGSDTISRQYNIGQNLIKGGITYTVLSSTMIIIFNIVAIIVISQVG
ncbi:hypothetical protein HOC99_05010 [Candidatus Woesearchaeota archaeon]|jgi:Flp pilus assembly protein TadB|nr:hypothetical protein [Candidatus Woesearchaeota archaeon]MBT4387263.1 hypothetical protein [Candidatus Woesearchaeota archaeon]MBT4596264.1 hypothetical protein [Candidatus Woesearchaeota archaeon]MBT5741513.1 hypothetical protein [Candidatus Woesearchaeota archaeon]MBT7296969.1 hypothetical protein [Candidatus Woesearchaeota archaeon]